MGTTTPVDGSNAFGSGSSYDPANVAITGGTASGLTMSNNTGVDNVLLVSNAATTISNTTNETTVLTKQIDANLMGSNGRLALRLVGSLLNSTGGTTNTTLQIKVKLGASTLYDGITSAASISSNASSRAFSLDIVLANASATNVQSLGGVLFVGGTASPVAGYGNLGSNCAIYTCFGADGAVDTTSNQTLAVTMTLGTASANFTVVVKQATLTLAK